MTIRTLEENIVFDSALMGVGDPIDVYNFLDLRNASNILGNKKIYNFVRRISRKINFATACNANGEFSREGLISALSGGDQSIEQQINWYFEHDCRLVDIAHSFGLLSRHMSFSNMVMPINLLRDAKEGNFFARTLNRGGNCLDDALSIACMGKLIETPIDVSIIGYRLNGDYETEGAMVLVMYGRKVDSYRHRFIMVLL